MVDEWMNGKLGSVSSILSYKYWMDYSGEGMVAGGWMGIYDGRGKKKR